MSLFWDWNGWPALEAVGTISAVVVALAGVWLERSRRRKAEAKQAQLERELRSERVLQLEAQKREQALHVLGWARRTTVDKRLVVEVANESSGPIFDVRISLRGRHSGGRYDMPQQEILRQRDGHWCFDVPDLYQQLYPSEEPVDTAVVFRDLRENTWERTSTGRLTQVASDFRPDFEWVTDLEHSDATSDDIFQ